MFSVSDSGTWYHLATRVDSELKTVSLFVNGEKVKQTKLMKPSDYWLIGPASIGNWDPKRLQKPLRNLNGSIAEIMIFSQALDDNYIKRLALID
ncbi:LamG-like jellyroll fold domain-containing protein [Psychrosphaera algicola]|uniref:Sialidase domain-containing protein n=1 Tax=Psychrosphaera algicola TaxID=3023714 RepID=A0ABT5FAS2_9GAMM|nr:LamG-like jellyroll fold domain-containing protein [Psychrosphaera sp. G1-22]MDC2887675.1 sialidase domain-containing protein [Psychrosphaera sp. G1-22]